MEPSTRTSKEWSRLTWAGGAFGLPPASPLGEIRFGFVCLLVGFVWLVAGCSHQHTQYEYQAGGTRVYTPLPPPFLDGPASLLFTNFTGFSAHIEVETNATTHGEAAFSGELLGRGSKLLFAPAHDVPTTKNAPAGGFSFLWDAASGGGYVLSEALQGCAPVSAGVRATNVVNQGASPGPQPGAGTRTRSEQMLVQSSDGSSAVFELTRATDLNGFPIRIHSLTPNRPLSLNLSKVRFELAPESLFTPPPDFTKYKSPEVLADELFVRHRNLHRKIRETELPATPPVR